MHRSLVLALLVMTPGCAAMGKVPPAADEGDDPFKRSSDALASDGRWVPDDSTRRAGEAQSGRYEAAPLWGSSSCAGGMLPGTRALGEHLVATFASAARFEGYSCRRNTADRSRMSVHGTGRALDLFVPLSGGDADNDAGDPIASWLVTNATAIGVQLIIWDRAKWNISYAGRKDAPYGGGHPHHDHLHIELTAAGAAMRTDWFDGSGGDDGSMPVPPDAVDPACNDTCPYARDGECDDGSDGGLVYCGAGSDCTDCRADTAAPGGGTYPNAGLELDSMAIPYRGLENSTLAGTGMGSVEPLGDVITHAGGRYVRGRISQFGGPDDRGVSSTETGTITGERLRSLNDPLSPSAATLASRPSDYYFVAMRWRYSPHGRSWLANARVLVVAPESGRAVVLRPVDWGPHTRTSRIIDVSPQAIRDLGVSTDADVLVSWAPAGTALGVFNASAAPPGGGGDTGSTGTEGCSDTCRYASDGECDDGGSGADYAVCALGTDCADCGARSGTPPPAPPRPDAGLCSNTCAYASDGDCDDGGPGSLYSICALGTDCDDCGSRSTSSPAPAPPAAATGESCSSASSCETGLSCRSGYSDPSLHCCVEAASSCTSGADCCGYMDCIDGTCACRAAGRSCLASADCCSGSCSSGRCL